MEKIQITNVICSTMINFFLGAQKIYIIPQVSKVMKCFYSHRCLCKDNICSIVLMLDKQVNNPYLPFKIITGTPGL